MRPAIISMMQGEPSGMPELRQAVRDRPEAIVGWTTDGQAILLLGRLSEPGLRSVARAQALRRVAATKLVTGVWLVPRALLEQQDTVPEAWNAEAEREAFMRRNGL